MSAPLLTVVGMCPNAGSVVSVARRPGLALTGQTGHRLADLLDWTWERYLMRTQRSNVLRAWAGGPWPALEAQTRADAMGAVIRGPVLLLGQMVADAFDLAWLPDRLPVVECPAGRLRVARCALVIPHPSGRNRWYNQEMNRERARRALRELTRGRR